MIAQCKDLVVTQRPAGNGWEVEIQKYSSRKDRKQHPSPLIGGLVSEEYEKKRLPVIEDFEREHPDSFSNETLEEQLERAEAQQRESVERTDDERLIEDGWPYKD